jgi:cytidine deaminase
MSVDDLRRLIVEAIGDGDATVIEDVVVEVVTDQFARERFLPCGLCRPLLLTAISSVMDSRDRVPVCAFVLFEV